METCSNCFSINLIETDENITCCDCSRVQSSLLFGNENNDTGNKHEQICDFVEEYHEREYLSKNEKEQIIKRLDTLRCKKSVFSKQELTVTLIYIARMESGYVISTQAFCKSVGMVLTSKRLNLCFNYLKSVLRLSMLEFHLDWKKLIEPYCEKYKLLRRNEIHYLTQTCEKIRSVSNLSVFSVVAISFISSFLKFRDLKFVKVLEDIASFSQISKYTLKKNCKKYEMFLFKE